MCAGALSSIEHPSSFGNWQGTLASIKTINKSPNSYCRLPNDGATGRIAAIQAGWQLHFNFKKKSCCRVAADSKDRNYRRNLLLRSRHPEGTVGSRRLTGLEPAA